MVFTWAFNSAFPRLTDWNGIKSLLQKSKALKNHTVLQDKKWPCAAQHIMWFIKNSQFCKKQSSLDAGDDPQLEIILEILGWTKSTYRNLIGGGTKKHVKTFLPGYSVTVCMINSTFFLEWIALDVSCSVPPGFNFPHSSKWVKSQK